MDTDSLMRPVLVVEDDASARLILSAELEGAGYRPIPVASASEALARLQADRCRVVITDWCMPEMDGIELCRRIRSMPGLASTYVIMVTVNNDQARLIKAFDAGVDDFLSKPIEPVVLMARMRAACRNTDLQDALVKRNEELEAVNGRLLELATTDELTGLSNRRHGLACLERRWLESAARGTPLCVAIVDIDRFKQLNDTYGHTIGDRALQGVARVLQRGCLETFPICRYGGEEFLVVLPDTDRAAAARAARQWKENVGAHRLIEGTETIAVTISIGLATKTQAHADAAALIRAADDALYAAKAAGRNIVRIAA